MAAVVVDCTMLYTVHMEMDRKKVLTDEGFDKLHLKYRPSISMPEESARARAAEIKRMVCACYNPNGPFRVPFLGGFIVFTGEATSTKLTEHVGNPFKSLWFVRREGDGLNARFTISALTLLNISIDEFRQKFPDSGLLPVTEKPYTLNPESENMIVEGKGNPTVNQCAKAAFVHMAFKVLGNNVSSFDIYEYERPHDQVKGHWTKMRSSNAQVISASDGAKFNALAAALGLLYSRQPRQPRQRKEIAW